ncbi:MAG: hypothetical protein M3Z02_04085 [Actinomycetota bacterium]|nr:hypothetical protein [Actinomycetota bacterium]
MTQTGPDWSSLVGDYHAAHAGITEDLLMPMVDAAGREPYGWLVDGLAGTGLVWDACCGSAPVADRVGLGRYRGVDASAAELAAARRRRPGVAVTQGDVHAVPLPAGVTAVTVAMALMLLDLDAFLGHLAPALPSGALVHAIVPNRGPAAGLSDYAELLTLLGQAGIAYREPLDPAGLRSRFAAAGFTLDDDETALFHRPVRTGAEVALVVHSFYAPGAQAAGVEEARRWLSERRRAPGYALAYPLRRLRAHRR